MRHAEGADDPETCAMAIVREQRQGGALQPRLFAALA